MSGSAWELAQSIEDVHCQRPGLCSPMSSPHPQFDHYRLVLIEPRGRSIMLDESSEGLLPRVLIPRWTRAVRRITAQIRERWNIGAVVLDFLEGKSRDGNVVIAQSINGPWDSKAKAHGCWHDLGAVPRKELTEFERSIISRLLEDGSTGRGPFSRIGWIEELLTWSANALQLERLQLSDEIVQLNASADAALVQISCRDGSTYWFKAPGKFHPIEQQMTAALSQQFPEYVPEMIAVHTAWNGWLMPDAGIPFLSSPTGSTTLAIEVVRRLGELQSATIPVATSLFTDGCHDHRLSTLRAQLPDLMFYLEEAMREPDIHFGPCITPSRLRRIGDMVAETTAKLEDMGIPDALMHCDISLENILIGRYGCMFIDWAQAGIGPPFVTFAHLSGQFAQHAGTRPMIQNLEEVYVGIWEALLPGCHPRRAMQLIPLVASASLLYCKKDCFEGEAMHGSRLFSYARVLARQMDSAAHQIEEIWRGSDVEPRRNLKTSRTSAWGLLSEARP